VSTPLLSLVLFTALAFFAGSIPFGWILARLRGIDLTRVGSGNIGATNAARALGKGAGVFVLVLDAAKGFLPVLLAQRWQLVVAELPWPGSVPALVGFCAILGHVFSPWMRWKGGKGVATSLGVFLALSPISALVAAGAWLVCYLVLRIASVGSLVAAATLVVMMFVRHEPVGSIAAVIATFVLVVARHADNIKRLMAGSEGRV
jgi:glycerol-3-phosphate acyltransferase PlsY